MNAIENVSNRRKFLKGVFSAGAFVVASRVLPESAFAQDPAVRTRAQSAPLSPSVYLGVDPDGTVDVWYNNSQIFTNVPIPGFAPIANSAFQIGAQPLEFVIEPLDQGRRVFRRRDWTLRARCSR